MLRDTLTLAMAPRHWDPTSGDPSGLLLQPHCAMGKEQDGCAPGGSCVGSPGAIKSTHRTPSMQERGSTASFHPAQRKRSSWKQHPHGTEHLVTSGCLSPTAGKTPPENERGGARYSTKEQQSALSSFCPFSPLQRITNILKIIIVRNKSINK